MASLTNSTSLTITSIAQISAMVTEKLTSKNYLSWQDQILPLIEGISMGDHVLFDSKAPKATRLSLDGKEEQNPLLAIWLQEDRLVKSLIVATLSPAVRNFTAGLKSARDVWKVLEERFANSSKERARDLLRQLREVKRDEHPTHDAYLQKINMISNELAAIKEPLDDGDKVYWSLNGLGDKYDSFVTPMQNLLSNESKYLLHIAEEVDTTIVLLEAEVNQEEFESPHSTTIKPATRTQMLNNKDQEDIPKALAAFSIIDSQDPDWVPDIGAMSHLTNDPSNLVNVKPYRGTDKIIVGDGLIHFNSQQFSIPCEPKTLKTALSHPGWCHAMKEELIALSKNQTWTLVSRHSSMNVIGSKWVYKTKLKADGSLERLKARLVAKGFNQQAGIDYEETFSLVIKPQTIHIVLTIALAKGWTIKQLDVQNAFLHGYLKESVYIEQPPGFKDPTHLDHVCQLNRALYGLKQVPRAWFK
ncbi:hypothetical protein SLEP1_g56338 [Rubroshorea leprosula]|uniref:Reverse transcriptase Ty1/copia-type domain-containing protein n=1 Tax=Rubroshorea leprosula TaxID=152421 RepID=A0AAV5MI15_9ROSI|nr:hypothetical protein SLEP1_g56338 [Rubroshorea leprosula]